MPFATKTTNHIPTNLKSTELQQPMKLTSLLSGTAAISAVGFGLMNLATGGLPMITIGAVAAGVAIRTKILSDGIEKTPTITWHANVAEQEPFDGKVTANYLISCLKEVDTVLTHRQYKKNWWVGKTHTDVFVMVGSHGDFKTFKTRDEMLSCAYAFVKMGVWRECSELEIDVMRPKRKYITPSAIDYIARGIDLDDSLPLGRLIRYDHADKPLDSYDVLSQGWMLYAMKNGMFLAKRGTTNLTWRVFYDRDQFYRFFDRAMQKEKRILLPSEELGQTVEDSSSLDSDDDLMQGFLNNIIFITDD